MAKTTFVRDPQSADSSEKREIDYRALLDGLAERAPFEHAAILTTLPRGSMQIVQPHDLNDALLKTYREFHAHDRISWEAMTRRQTVRAMDCWPAGQLESSSFMTGFIRPLQLQFAVAAPLMAPVLDGYPGVIALYRTAEQGAFDAKSVTALTAFATELDEKIAAREPNADLPPERETPLNHHIPMRLFAFDSNLRLSLGKRYFDSLDASLRQNMLDLARQRFGQVNGKQMATDRVPLPDSRGDLWNFRVVVHSTFPAIGEGPFVFFCVQPDCGDWSLLRPNDFAADQELSRLVPALTFMQQNFGRRPTLQEIARTVHLSPFHFHRRFTELLGITPKHFLLDCQIEQAKAELISRQKELAEIAKECGFAHQSHFTSRFKQATGLTPTRWRRLALEQPRR